MRHGQTLHVEVQGLLVKSQIVLAHNNLTETVCHILLNELNVIHLVARTVAMVKSRNLG